MVETITKFNIMKTETLMKLWMGALFASVVFGIVWNVIVECTK